MRYFATRRASAAMLAVAATLGASTMSRGQGPAPPDGARRPDVIFVPTPREVVDRMLELAEIQEGDVLYDLGCGDGRIVVAAAKRYGIKAVGLEIDPRRAEQARENVRKNGVEALVTIRRADLFEADISEATVVTLYLLPDLNARLMPRLARLKPGSRIVSHAFGMRGARPRKVEKAPLRNGTERTVYLWVVPWDEEPARRRSGDAGHPPQPRRDDPPKGGTAPPRRPPSGRGLP